MVLDAKQGPMTHVGVCRRIGHQLGINTETLRGWVTQAEIDNGGTGGHHQQRDRSGRGTGARGP